MKRSRKLTQQERVALIAAILTAVAAVLSAIADLVAAFSS